jgi:hypothetical protein
MGFPPCRMPQGTKPHGETLRAAIIGLIVSKFSPRDLSWLWFAFLPVATSLVRRDPLEAFFRLVGYSLFGRRDPSPLDVIWVFLFGHFYR